MESPSHSSNRGLIIGIVIVTVLIFAGLVWAIVSAPPDSSGNNTGGSETNLSFNDQNDPAVGPADAKVVVRMFEDFECPYCQIADAGVQHAIQKYSDRVQFIWDDFPLLTVHPNARIAADAARCAEDQGKFWEYHNALYAHQSDWGESKQVQDKLIGYANQLGLDQNAFASCLSSKKEDGKVMDDVNEGFRNNVDSTPTFFVNNSRYHFQTGTEWDQALDQALAQTAATSSPATTSTP